MNFLALYKSSTTTTTGCVKQFATTEREELSFAPQVQRPCDLCGVTHNFRLDRVVTLGTPRQRKNVRGYCEQQGIDLDIDVEVKASS